MLYYPPKNKDHVSELGKAPPLLCNYLTTPHMLAMLCIMPSRGEGRPTEPGIEPGSARGERVPAIKGSPVGFRECSAVRSSAGSRRGDMRPLPIWAFII